MNKDVNKYNKSIHRLGYIFTAFISVAVVAVPIVVCTVYDCMPKFSNIIGPMLTIMAAFLPVQLSEVISFAPILGSASYMTFVTGNVTNLKLPAAVSAQKMAEVDAGTPEGDAVATMAVAVSSIVTIAIMCLCVILFVPLQPVLTSPTFGTMTKFVLPALWGSLAWGIFSNSKKKGAKIITRKWLIPALPMAITVLAILFVPTFAKIQSFYLIGLIVFTILWAFFLYKRGTVVQTIRE